MLDSAAPGGFFDQGGVTCDDAVYAAVPVVLAALALGAPAQAADSLKMYEVTIDAEGAGTLHGLGVDMGHTGYKPSIDSSQTIFVDLLDGQAAKARDEG